MIRLFRAMYAFVSRDFRMGEAFKRLPQHQRKLLWQLDKVATRFRRSMDHTGEVLGDSGVHHELIQRAAAAREERNTLVGQCTSAGVPKELVEYFGSLSR